MKTIISSFFFGIRDLMNGINNTVWGISILYVTMWIFVHCPNQANIAYYFAGIASTLLGIKQDHPQLPQGTNITASQTTTVKTETPDA